MQFVYLWRVICIIDSEDDEEMLRAVQATESQLGGRMADLQQFEFQLSPTRQRRYRRFGISDQNFRLRIQQNVGVQGGNVVRAFEQGFVNALRPFVERLPANDQLQVYFNSRRINREYHSPLISIGEWGSPTCAAQRILTNLMRILQSNENFDLDDTFDLQILHVEMPPAASGPRSTKATKKSIRHNIVTKKNIIEIKNRDNLCCARAIVTAKAWVERNTSNEALHDYENIRRGYPIQQRKAEALHREANVPLGPCDLEAVAKFQAVLPQYQLIVVSAQQLYSIIFRGDVVNERKLYLLLDEKHYHVIKDMKTITGTAYYCVKCENGFDHDDFSHHRCEGLRCGSCQQLNCMDFLNRPDRYEMIGCDLCCREFFGQNCLLNHHTKTAEGQQATALTKSSVCYSHKKCRLCYKTIIGKTKHSCGKGKCHSCEKNVDLLTHKCFLQPADPQRKKKKTP